MSTLAGEVQSLRMRIADFNEYSREALPVVAQLLDNHTDALNNHTVALEENTQAYNRLAAAIEEQNSLRNGSTRSGHAYNGIKTNEPSYTYTKNK